MHADRGAITINHISSSFPSHLSAFTLFGATSGGPPTTYTWTRNGQVITNSASYSISIEAREDEETSGSTFQSSRYRSTLIVTGRLPGVYQYSVTNRATSGMVTDTFTIESMITMHTKLISKYTYPYFSDMLYNSPTRNTCNIEQVKLS